MVKHSRRRQLLTQGERLIQSAHANDADPGEIAAKTADELTQIGAGGNVSDTIDATEVVRDVLLEIDQPERRLGLPTGFNNFDMEIGGLYPGELVVLAARPRMGKTSLALNIMASVANAGRNVLFISLEMSANQLGQRLLSAESGVDGNRLRTGELTDEDRAALVRASNELPLDLLHLVERLAQRQLPRKRPNSPCLHAGGKAVAGDRSKTAARCRFAIPRGS